MTDHRAPNDGSPSNAATDATDATAMSDAAFDAATLTRYLEGRLDGVHGSLVVERFTEGYSNLTYHLRAGEHHYVLRHGPKGVAIRGGHDMAREFRVLSGLASVYDKVPRPLVYCDDPSVLGIPFYVMEWIPGTILRARFRPGPELDPSNIRRVSEQFVDTLVEVHGLDYVAAGLEDLGRPEGYGERQVKGWTERYRAAQTHDLPELERVVEWLAENKPPTTGAALIHNDFKYDNLVWDGRELQRIVAILDWEMATIGDPILDLGTALGYWVQANDPSWFAQMRFGPTHLPGSLTRSQLVARYGERSGRDTSSIVYAYVLALFKIGVIAQQLYRRHRDGKSSDARHADLHESVRRLGRAGAHVIAHGSIDDLDDGS